MPFSSEPEAEGCEYLCVHEETVARLLKALPPDETLYDLAELFKVFGVCDLARLLGITQAAVSHQLRVLKASALVRARREGKVTFYALDDDHVHSILRQGMEHIQE